MFKSRSSIVDWLWNHNPFYVISALLMLYGVRKSYGELDIGTINCWIMTAVLGAYTVLLATVGTLIVRWGKVWDDARSILLVLLFLFLAVSISADDLFVKMESVRGGAILMICGFAFSLVVLLGVLRATRIRLRVVYLVPLILFLALFFVAPWWCSPELHPQNSVSLDWSIFLFPQIAAALTLGLIPAARMGERSVENNGTPWPWPLFPWSAFLFVGVAVVLRSYGLAMTFSQTGPLWTSPISRSGIVFDTIWRPYFLVPLAFAILLLMLESGVANGRRIFANRSLVAAPSVLLLAWPWSPSEPMTEFLDRVTWTLGSPVWLTVLILIAFYGWAELRRVPYAETGVLLSVLLLTIIGPKSVSFETFNSPNPIPLLLVGGAIGVVGVARRSSILALMAISAITAGLWIWIPETALAKYREAICYHIVFATCVLISVAWNDLVSKRLQSLGALLIVLSAYVVLDGPIDFDVSWETKLAYVTGLSWIGYVCARSSRSRFYWSAFLGSISLLAYAITADAYRNASLAFGRNAVIAFFWSFGTFLIGVLISAYKANWLPPLISQSSGGSAIQHFGAGGETNTTVSDVGGSDPGNLA